MTCSVLGRDRVGTIVVDSAMIKFDVHDKPYTLNMHDMKKFISGAKTAVDVPSSLEFTEVTICRAITLNMGTSMVHMIIGHRQQMFYHREALTSEQILAMTKYKFGISDEQWIQYMYDCAGCSSSSRDVSS